MLTVALKYAQKGKCWSPAQQYYILSLASGCLFISKKGYLLKNKFFEFKMYSETLNDSLKKTEKYLWYSVSCDLWDQSVPCLTMIFIYKGDIDMVPCLMPSPSNSCMKLCLIKTETRYNDDINKKTEALCFCQGQTRYSHKTSL